MGTLEHQTDATANAAVANFGKVEFRVAGLRLALTPVVALPRAGAISATATIAPNAAFQTVR
jgi:hypothetical protein